MSRLGIKQPKAANVTGTIVMLDDPEGRESTLTTATSHDVSAKSSELKRTGDGIILHPQPHDSPNDPLNWPLIRKDLCFLIIGFQTFLGGGQTPILAAGLSRLSAEFHRSMSNISYLVGGFMLALGFGSVFASPTAILYGKRLVYLIGILLFLVGSIWAAAAPNFGNLMGARVLMAFGASPTESLASASLSELYFQHERAYRVGLYTMLLLGGKNIVPLLSGLIFQHLNRHWLFWILSMFLGATLILTFLFVPETFWDRSPTPNKRSLEESRAARLVKSYRPPTERPNAWALHEHSRSMVYSEFNTQNEVESLQSLDNTSVHPVGVTDPAMKPEKNLEDDPRNFASRLAVFSGRHTIDSWWMVALRPFFLYGYPAVSYGSIIYCFAVVWLIVISETISLIFEGEGYRLSQQSVGLFYISPFVGGILGSLLAGLIGDRVTRFLVAKNHGIYEPEFRLLMLIPATFFISFGLMGFGWSSFEKDFWIGPIIFFGSVSFGCSMASTTAITFTVDSYKMFAGESLVTLNFTKNFIGFIFSLFNNHFVDNANSKTAFVVYGCLQLIFSLIGIPMYIYGKKLRSWTDEKEILKILYHADNLDKIQSHSEKAPSTEVAREETAYIGDILPHNSNSESTHANSEGTNSNSESTHDNSEGTNVSGNDDNDQNKHV